MFGSNNPRFEQIRMLDALRNIGWRESTLDLVLGKNALTIFRLKEEGMFKLEKFVFLTENYNQMILLTDQLRRGG